MMRNTIVPRVAATIRCDITVEPDSEPIPAVTVNISETGVCLRSEAPIAPESQIAFELDLLDDGITIPITARVIWSRQDPANKVVLCGAQFANIAETDSQAIRDFVIKESQWIVDFLHEFPLFENFTDQDCRNMLRLITIHTLEHKEVLYTEGSDVPELSGLFIVYSGLLNIFKGHETEAEKQIATVSAGQVFGETTLMKETPHNVTVAAVNDSKLLQINTGRFRSLKEHQPDLAIKILEVALEAISQRLWRTTRLLFSPANRH